MNPSKHGMINSSSILFNSRYEIFDNSIIFHFAFPLGQVGIHVVPGHEIVLIIYAVFL